MNITKDWSVEATNNLWRSDGRETPVDIIKICCKHCTFFYSFVITKENWWPEHERHNCSVCTDRLHSTVRYMNKKELKEKIETFRKMILLYKLDI